jgi:hypothetical protein
MAARRTARGRGAPFFVRTACSRDYFAIFSSLFLLMRAALSL